MMNRKERRKAEKTDNNQINNSYLKDHQVAMYPLILGTYIMKYELPMKMVNDINSIYDKAKTLESQNDELIGKILQPWNDNLAGKIVEENNIDSLLTPEINEIFMGCFKGYMTHALPKRTQWIPVLSTAWINEMKAEEYNPFHTHSSAKSEIGLSSVLVLKRPSHYGKEYANENIPTNGHLAFSGGQQDLLSIAEIRLDAQVGEFYVFPYTVTHGVYPFNGTDETRRTLSYNCDLLRAAPAEVKTEEK